MFINSAAATPRVVFQDAGHGGLLPKSEEISEVFGRNSRYHHHQYPSSHPLLHPHHHHFRGRPASTKAEVADKALVLSHHRHNQSFWPSPPSLTPSPDPERHQQRDRVGDEGELSHHTSSSSSDSSSVVSSLDVGFLNRHFPQPRNAARPPKQQKQQHISRLHQPQGHHQRFHHNFGPRQGAMMAGVDDWAMSDFDGIQDNYETKQLHKDYLAGTAGSPYSRSERSNLCHPLFSQQCQQRNSGPVGAHTDTAAHAEALLGHQSYTPPSCPPSSYVFSAITDMTGSGLSMFPAYDGLPVMQNNMHGMPASQHNSGDLFGAGMNNGDLSSGSLGMGGPHGFGSSSFSSVSSAGSSQGNETPVPFSFGANCSTHGNFDARAWPHSMGSVNEGTMSPHDLPLKSESASIGFTEAQGQTGMLFADNDGDEDMVKREPNVQDRYAGFQATGGGTTSSSATNKEKRSSKSSSTSGKGIRSNNKSRKDLPDRAPRPHKPVSIQATLTNAASLTSFKAVAPSVSASSTRVSSKAPQSSLTTTGRTLTAQKIKSPKSPQPRKVLRSPTPSAPRPFKALSAESNPRNSSSGSCRSTSVATNTSTADRAAKDDFLVISKRKGMTYREIRAAGQFTEAESTLRGRFRTLTKSKEERVRRPEWTPKDIRLLRKSVRKFSKRSDPGNLKTPWKRVAEYIHQKGGSYLFGNATCRKKWDDLMMEEEEVEEDGDEEEEEYEDEEEAEAEDSDMEM